MFAGCSNEDKAEEVVVIENGSAFSKIPEGQQSEDVEIVFDDIIFREIGVPDQVKAHNKPIYNADLDQTNGVYIIKSVYSNTPKDIQDIFAAYTIQPEKNGDNVQLKIKKNDKVIQTMYVN